MLQSKSKRIAETQIALVKFAPAKIAPVGPHVRAKIATAVVPAKPDKPLMRGWLYFKNHNQQKNKKMKSKRSKKQIALNVAFILTILFLSLAATERIIRTPAIISGFSRWSLLVLPFLQTGRISKCSCNNSISQ